ncbi:FliA/WhiG family RNA polymerase sigma factor [Clostridium sp.]|uniref:FliA/WhiG family RNA polymerase sigma factor n=1 Tax=Clostridium sp. TaxID=1506 RepID=UPI002FCA7811
MSVAHHLDLKTEIVKKYLPLVKYIASKIIVGKTKYVEYEDLVSYGMLGLMDALSKFDESKGMKFSTYASIRVKGSMIDELRRNSPIPKRSMDKLNRYNAAVESLQNKLLRDPTDMEIAKAMEINLEELGQIEGYVNYMSMVSLDSLLFSEDDDVALLNSIEDVNSPSPQKTLEDKEMYEYLLKALELLRDKDKLVLNLYYYEGLTLKQIGEVLEVSESRVCQLHSKAILNLRKAIEKLKYNINE